MPKFISFGKFHHISFSQINQHHFRMGAVHIRKSRNGKVSVRSPFAMVKGIPRRRRQALNQVADTVDDKKPLVRSIIFSDILASCLTAEIKEQGSLGTILGERYVAGLFTLVPYGFLSRNSCTQKSRSRYGEGIIFADSPMISPVKKFLRLTEFTLCKRDLPSRRLFERRFFLIVSRIGHVDNDRISRSKHAPARNRRRYDIQLDQIRAIGVQVANIKSRPPRHTFETCTESHTLSVRRNFRMVDRHRIRNFIHRKNSAGIIYISQISRQVVSEGETSLVCSQHRTQSCRTCKWHNSA